MFALDEVQFDVFLGQRLASLLGLGDQCFLELALTAQYLTQGVIFILAFEEVELVLAQGRHALCYFILVFVVVFVLGLGGVGWTEGLGEAGEVLNVVESLLLGCD